MYQLTQVCAAGILLLLGSTCMAAAAPGERPGSTREFVTQHTAIVDGTKFRYEATVEETILVNDNGVPALSLFSTAYVRERAPHTRPVIFAFNGGPSGAAGGVHMQFGPRQPVSRSTLKPEGATIFENNPETILDVADLVFFDPAESGFSRILPGGSRDHYYSTAGDTESLAQFVTAWLKRHDRVESPRYLLGESYGSIRAVVTAELLQKAGTPVDGVIILANSLPLMETSRRTNNIISYAVSVPMMAMAAAYHGKVGKKGKTDEEFASEVYDWSMSSYLVALAKGHTLREAESHEISERLAVYTGIPTQYYLDHRLIITKSDFGRMLVPGKVLDTDDTRRLRVPDAESTSSTSPTRNRIADYMGGELRVSLPGLDYRPMSPDSFESWDWGTGCNEYLQIPGLCIASSNKPSIFMDYDWPEQLARCFRSPKFRTMIIAGYYDGLSSFGTTRYMAARETYPVERFEVHEYAGGHATAADLKARVDVMRDVRVFLAKGH
jgi:pimeloyl-ACP methyl ester carboxylesterase